MFKNFSDTRFLGKQVIYLPKCHSTNDIAAEMIRNGSASEGVVIITDYQTAGRGQRGNTWTSAENSNLLFSIVLCPVFLKVSEVFSLNIAVSLGIFDALSDIKENLKIKWPNDIYYKDRKLGGILIENNLRGDSVITSVAGVGLNINQENFEVEKAVSLKVIMKSDQDRLEIFGKVIRSIDARYALLKYAGDDVLRNDYLKTMYRFGELQRFRAGKEFNGVISGIDDSGRLKVKVDGNLRLFGFREIEYLD